MTDSPFGARLQAWLCELLPDAGEIGVEGFDRVEMGHSAETHLLTVVCDDRRTEVVLRIRPPEPGLLEPYDMALQFRILRALEATPVRSPRALWLEPTGQVLGREFYVMERLPGSVYERTVPDELRVDPDRVRRMCESALTQIAAIHSVDIEATGLARLGDGYDYLDRELDHWTEEIRRVRKGPLPALERLAGALRDQQPEPTPVITLVHGDPKPGNFAFVGAEVSAVFDWEMATIGDPLADIGWAEVLWSMPSSFPGLPGAMSADEMVAGWEELTGITAHHRGWYRAFQTMKMAVILLVGGHLYDAGHSDDPRLLDMTYGIGPLTVRALHDLGIDEPLDTGPVTPPPRRGLEPETR